MINFMDQIGWSSTFMIKLHEERSSGLNYTLLWNSNLFFSEIIFCDVMWWWRVNYILTPVSHALVECVAVWEPTQSHRLYVYRQRSGTRRFWHFSTSNFHSNALYVTFCTNVLWPRPPWPPRCLNKMDMECMQIIWLLKKKKKHIECWTRHVLLRHAKLIKDQTDCIFLRSILVLKTPNVCLCY